MAVSYFTAVIARSGAQWRAVDADVEDAESLDDLAEVLRGASRGGPVLAVIEREDDWFALVRVDDDEDPRAFVSDLPASERSQFAQVLAPVADVELGEYAHLRTRRPATADIPSTDDDVATEDEVPDEPVATDAGVPDDDLGLARSSGGDDAAAAEPLPWAGDPGLLADVGVDADALIELVDEGEGDPASVIASVGERCGFDELLDALR